MRRRVIWWVVMVIVLILIVLLASNNEGYILIVRSPYRVQFSFNFFLVCVVIGFLFAHYCLRIVHFFRRLPASKRSKKESQRLMASNEALLESLHALADGDYPLAEAAAKRAHDLIHDTNLEKVIQNIEKQKQEAS
jgi:HemY protein